MIKCKSIPNPEKNPKWYDSDIVINSSEEALICLNCPYSKCPKNGTCDYYLEKIKEIKGKKNE